MARLILVLTIVLHACNTASDRQKTTSEKPLTDNVAKSEKQIDPKNCVRGIAVPIINKAVYPQTTFVLQPDSLTGIETVAFDNGDNLIIKNWGCDYYVLTFRYETSLLKADTTALKYWYVTSYKIITEIKQGIDAPIDIEKGLQALNNYISKNVFDLKLNTEIDFGGDEIRSFVSVDRVEKVTDKKIAFEISFATGPL
ncbi:MAG TPA: hypothetical protein PLM70_10015 [Bacteroidales bacterium]|nr:hypothetical protein [Bacteroidales bacterium]